MSPAFYDAHLLSRMESGSIYTCFWLLSCIPVFPLMSKLYILNRCAHLFFSGHMGCSRTKLAINEPVHPCRQYRHFYRWLHFRAGAFQYLNLLVQVYLCPWQLIGLSTFKLIILVKSPMGRIKATSPVHVGVGSRTSQYQSTQMFQSLRKMENHLPHLTCAHLWWTSNGV